jgi:hypothetical protein
MFCYDNQPIVDKSQNKDTGRVNKEITQFMYICSGRTPGIAVFCKLFDQTY